MTKLRLTCPRAIERQLVAHAKKHFPREIFAYLLGTHLGDSVTIDELWFPEDLERWADDKSVVPAPEWYIDANEQAKESGLTICGWSHSHPYRYGEAPGFVRDHAQSEGDLECGIRLAVSGVVVVQDVGRIKPRLRASVKWWGPTIPVEVQ